MFVTIIFFEATKVSCDKHIFVATRDVFCRDKHMFVATKVILLWQNLCRNKIMLVATKLLLQ